MDNTSSRVKYKDCRIFDRIFSTFRKKTSISSLKDNQIFSQSIPTQSQTRARLNGKADGLEPWYWFGKFLPLLVFNQTLTIQSWYTTYRRVGCFTILLSLKTTEKELLNGIKRCSMIFFDAFNPFEFYLKPCRHGSFRVLLYFKSAAFTGSVFWESAQN